MNFQKIPTCGFSHTKNVEMCGFSHTHASWNFRSNYQVKETGKTGLMHRHRRCFVRSNQLKKEVLMTPFLRTSSQALILGINRRRTPYFFSPVSQLTLPHQKPEGSNF